jgi:hypothetical protein
LIWAGIGAGMAAGTKAVGLALYAPFVVLILYFIIFGDLRLRHLVYFSLAFAVLAFPWYLYSWIATGNPVFPFFNGIFHSPYSSRVFESFNRELAIKTTDKSLINLILSPFNLVFRPESFDGRLGFCILLFPMMLIFVRRVPYAVKSTLAITVIFYLIWFFGFPFARFLLPVGTLMAVAGSYFVEVAMRGKFPLRTVTAGALAVGLLLPLPPAYRDTRPRVLSVLRSAPKLDFLSDFESLNPYDTGNGTMIKGLPYIGCWEFINEHSPPDSKVGILTSFWTRADGYYLERGYYYLNPSEQNLYDFSQLRAGLEIENALEVLGITHVVIDSAVLSQFSEGSDWETIPGFDTFSTGVKALVDFCHTRPLLYDDGRYRVYQVRADSPSPSP